MTKTLEWLDDALASFENVTVGHWTDSEARTGCTLIAFDRARQCVVDVRGGAPGTRETDLFSPGRLVRRADAILLTGGSALGLAAADGVMRALRDEGRGFETAAGPVPIVPAAVLYDLAVGQPVWPDAEAGATAYRSRVPLAQVSRGQVGAGTGATSGKILGEAGATRGGIGLGVATWAAGSVAAIAAVNALGVVRRGDTGNDAPDVREHLLQASASGAPAGLSRQGTEPARENTTLVAVIVAAPVDQHALHRVCVAAHDAMARVIVPCHTAFDGDIVFAVGLEDGVPSAMATLPMTIAAELAVERAIRDAVTA